jgi:hypothetical protein
MFGCPGLLANEAFGSRPNSPLISHPRCLTIDSEVDSCQGPAKIGDTSSATRLGYRIRLNQHMKSKSAYETFLLQSYAKLFAHDRLDDRSDFDTRRRTVNVSVPIALRLNVRGASCCVLWRSQRETEDNLYAARAGSQLRSRSCWQRPQSDSPYRPRAAGIA